MDFSNTQEQTNMQHVLMQSGLDYHGKHGFKSQTLKIEPMSVFSKHLTFDHDNTKTGMDHNMLKEQHKQMMENRSKD